MVTRYGPTKKTGMMIKMQTLDCPCNVLEQAAFSGLELDAPIDHG